MTFRRRGCLAAAVAAALVILLPAGTCLYLSLRLPEDAPLPRMYRTEAALRALATAVEAYRDAHGAYPPGGPAGLDAAVRLLSRKVDYMPGGAPEDAWGRPFRYVPHTQYEAPDSPALRAPGGAPYAPGAFQLYSDGADGDSGLANPGAQRDNITNWDAARSWRPVYRAATTPYARE